jgi:hypothetical protein
MLLFAKTHESKAYFVLITSVAGTIDFVLSWVEIRTPLRWGPIWGTRKSILAPPPAPLDFGEGWITGDGPPFSVRMFHSKQTMNSFLCLTNPEPWYTWGGVEVYLHEFITSTLGGGEWSALLPRHPLDRWSLHVIWTLWRKKSLPCRALNSDIPVVQPVFWALYWLSYPVFNWKSKPNEMSRCSCKR